MVLSARTALLALLVVAALIGVMTVVFGNYEIIPMAKITDRREYPSASPVGSATPSSSQVMRWYSTTSWSGPTSRAQRACRMCTRMSSSKTLPRITTQSSPSLMSNDEARFRDICAGHLDIYTALTHSCRDSLSLYPMTRPEGEKFRKQPCIYHSVTKEKGAGHVFDRMVGATLFGRGRPDPPSSPSYAFTRTPAPSGG